MANSNWDIYLKWKSKQLESILDELMLPWYLRKPKPLAETMKGWKHGK